MAKLSLSKAWEETRSLARRDGKLFIATALALIALPVTVYGTLHPSALLGQTPQEGMALAFFFLVMAINILGRLAISSLALKPASVGEAIAAAARRLPAFFGAFLLFIVPVALALTPFLPEIMANPQDPPPTPLLAASAILILAFVVGVRLVLPLAPVAAAEPGGPIALLQRCWRISAGNWWRLAAFVIAFFTASVLATRAVGYIAGSALLLALGPLEPMAPSSLALAVVMALVGAAFTTLFSIMLARIYAQLAGGEASVPASGRRP